ncbi:MAG: hypothetical protein MPF33_06955 [Candidatus Aramenus sp.]|jgi:phosphoglycerol transferase MdoB-like AlkP superfamily enzyme|nr:hypothetical protein [Candidatus Aramenus sp.]MCI2414967.1 hypothetical protein [Candidatus Aramenus sp.]
MSLGTLYNITSQILGNHVNSGSLSEILVLIGLAIIVLMVFGGIVYGLFKVFSLIPRMTTKQFLLFLLGIALVLIAIGILLP